MTARRTVAAVTALLGLMVAGCRDDDSSSGGAVASTSTSTSAAPGTTGTTGTSSGGSATSVATPPSSTATTTTAPGPLEDVDVVLTPVAEVPRPVALAIRSGDPALYVATQDGTVRRVVGGRAEAGPALDITGSTRASGEQGLLGLAFSPDGAFAYVNYTDRSGDTHVDEYAWTAEGRADTASRREVLRQDQPYANHNGGNLVFGPDGRLYLGFGDGGSGGDPQRRATDLGTWLGKLLRIDPRPQGGRPYGVPTDNPFVGQAGALPEIWAMGLRNPWRFSFDTATDDLWIADVGQGDREEIDRVTLAEARGADYGWSAFEGTRPYNDDVDATGAVAPVYEYPHGERGCSITGGFVYRGSAVPGLVGAYVYADYCAPGIWSLRVGPDGTMLDEARLVDDADGVASFGQGPDGELYVLQLQEGLVSRIDPA